MNPPLLIENGTLWTGGATPAVRRGQALLIENGCIARIAPSPAAVPAGTKRIDATGCLVLPGFINAHTHFYSTFARGLTRTVPASDFAGVLRNLWWRLDTALTLEDCHLSAVIALLDAVRHGTTTCIDHHASPLAVRGSLESVAQAVRLCGVRACLCYEVSDRDGEAVARAGLEENAEWIRSCAAHPGGPLQALFGLHASFTLSDATLAAAAESGHGLGAGFHIHAAEAESDQEATVRQHGLRVVERLHRFGILGPRTIAAHGVHLSGSEMRLLAETQTALVHNPQSNLNNAVGTADVVAMAAAGVRLGLGTDAMTANMLEELRVALWAQRGGRQNPSVGFPEVTAALFAGNPAIAGAIFGQTLGVLSEGAAADVVLMAYDPPTPLDDGNSLGHLLFGVSQGVVDTTIAAGRVLMEHRRLCLDLDEARVCARARERSAALWGRL